VGTDTAGTRLPWIEEIGRSFPARSFDAFHRHDLPQLLDRAGDVIAADIVAAPTVAFRVEDGTTFAWAAGPGGMEVREGEGGAATLVELPEEVFSDFLHELLTASGTVRTGRARIVRGALADWQRWEPAIRALLYDRAIYTPAVWNTLVDAAGEPLDLHRVFSQTDAVDEMRQFLLAAGYLHIRSVFSPEEIAVYSAEVEECRRRTAPGDPFSWWSVNAAGEEVVTRINYLDRFSAALLRLAHDPRLARYARLAGEELRVCDDRLDGPMVFVKNSGVVKGNGDLGWHVDDGIGGHPVMCPLIQAGIQLDHANAENGQLLVLAGSHRYAKHWLSWGEEAELPAVALETGPGDLTIHFGDCMHTTPPPTGRNAGRRALYYKFAEPKTFDWVPAGCPYNDALFTVDPAGHVQTRAATY
jgi:hypothetical protein